MAPLPLRMFSLLLIAMAAGADAEDRRSALLPDFMRVQFAGEAGLLSGGPGYAFWDRRFEASLSYGFVPRLLASQSAHIISQRDALSLARLEVKRAFLEPAVLGLAANFSLGKRYEVLLPKSQRDYYWPDGLYFWFFGGMKAGWMSGGTTGGLDGIAAQVEVGTLNQYVKTYRINDSIGLNEILSFAISLQFYLR